MVTDVYGAREDPRPGRQRQADRGQHPAAGPAASPWSTCPGSGPIVDYLDGPTAAGRSRADPGSGRRPPGRASASWRRPSRPVPTWLSRLLSAARTALLSTGLRLWANAPLAPFTTIGTGGKAGLLVTVADAAGAGRGAGGCSRRAGVALVLPGRRLQPAGGRPGLPGRGRQAGRGLPVRGRPAADAGRPSCGDGGRSPWAAAPTWPAWPLWWRRPGCRAGVRLRHPRLGGGRRGHERGGLRLVHGRRGRGGGGGRRRRACAGCRPRSWSGAIASAACLQGRWSPRSGFGSRRATAPRSWSAIATLLRQRRESQPRGGAHVRQRLQEPAGAARRAGCSKRPASKECAGEAPKYPPSTPTSW